MSNKVSSLATFKASKTDAAPAPLEAETPKAPSPAPAPAAEKTPKPEVDPAAHGSPPAYAGKRKNRMTAKAAADSSVRTVLNVRVSPAFRKSLKIYAARMDTDMADIIREGVELYRKKHGEPTDEPA